MTATTATTTKPATSETVVNSCTQWGRLEEVIVAALPPDACYPPEGPDFRGECNNDYIRASMLWPTGRKHPAGIKRANLEYDGLAAVLAAEGVVVRRPALVPQNRPVVTPYWRVPNTYNCCPRDKLLVVGREVIEAAMSQRARIFEEYCYRDLLAEYMRRDSGMLWTAAPKPMMRDALYRHAVDEAAGRVPAYWDVPRPEQEARKMRYEFSTTEDEAVWDAADVTRCGRDVFVHHGMTTNLAGFEWLRRHLASRGVAAHLLHFPDDLRPSHMDCTFVPLRPGLVLTNPERPPVEAEMGRFREGGWRLAEAPRAADINYPMPDWSQCSAQGLSMNVLNVSESKVVVEENEKGLAALLEEFGFDVISVPFRNTYQFGGSLHCATVDVRRDDAMKDFFAGDYS